MKTARVSYPGKCRLCAELFIFPCKFLASAPKLRDSQIGRPASAKLAALGESEGGDTRFPVLEFRQIPGGRSPSKVLCSIVFYSKYRTEFLNLS
jgi:hypothetical protein